MAPQRVLLSDQNAMSSSSLFDHKICRRDLTTNSALTTAATLPLASQYVICAGTADLPRVGHYHTNRTINNLKRLASLITSRNPSATVLFVTNAQSSHPDSSRLRDAIIQAAAASNVYCYRADIDIAENIGPAATTPDDWRTLTSPALSVVVNGINNILNDITARLNNATARRRSTHVITPADPLHPSAPSNGLVAFNIRFSCILAAYYYHLAWLHRDINTAGYISRKSSTISPVDALRAGTKLDAAASLFDKENAMHGVLIQAVRSDSSFRRSLHSHAGQSFVLQAHHRLWGVDDKYSLALNLAAHEAFPAMYNKLMKLPHRRRQLPTRNYFVEDAAHCFASFDLYDDYYGAAPASSPPTSPSPPAQLSPLTSSRCQPSQPNTNYFVKDIGECFAEFDLYTAYFGTTPPLLTSPASSSSTQPTQRQTVLTHCKSPQNHQDQDSDWDVDPQITLE